MCARRLTHLSAGPGPGSGYAAQRGVLAAALPLACLLSVGALAAQSQPLFEAPPTKALRVSPDGASLFALDTDGHRLVIYDLADPRAPRRVDALFAGLAPVALATRGDDDLWVVDWLGDAVHVVSRRAGTILRTIPCGDEPIDVVFAGNPARAFVAVAGEHRIAVFDPDSGVRLASIEVFGEQPRALVVGPGGATVWVAAHRSGNGTTIVPAEVAPPAPPTSDPSLPPPPRQGLIVRSDDPQWREVLGAAVADRDLFELDVAALAVRRHVAAVGSTLFASALGPAGDALYVAHTDAHNLVRFEPALRGRAVRHAVSRVSLGDLSVRVRDLNVAAARELALAQPADLCWSPDGRALFVAAFGSDRIGVLDGDGEVVARIDVSFGATSPRAKRGPRALAHHPRAPVLYVLQSLSGTLAVIDVELRAATREVALSQGSVPAALRQGRGFLYDARLSGLGTMSCAVCHVDGETDGLAWDLGDPGGAMQRVDNHRIIDLDMHPMKGPLRTQTLRGLTPDTRPFHHRGDRATLADFNASFASLLGGTPLADDDLALFTDFLAALVFPPNPHQNLDRSYAGEPAGQSARDGERLFREHLFSGPLTCQVCHRLPIGTNGVLIPGQLLHGDAQAFKTSHLRDVYRRLGRVPVAGLRRAGFGLMHDGAVDSVDDLLQLPFFRELADDADRRSALARFVLAFDTGTAPAVGFAVTIGSGREVVVADLRAVDLLEAQARAGHCDLAVAGVWQSRRVGLMFEPGPAHYRSIGGVGETVARAGLLDAVRSGQATLTFVGTMPGQGRRVLAGAEASGDAAARRR